MSSGSTSVMEFKFVGDVSSASAAIQTLRAKLADMKREGDQHAKAAAKGSEDAAKALLNTVVAADKVKGKMRELTQEVQKFQKEMERAPKQDPKMAAYMDALHRGAMFVGERPQTYTDRDDRLIMAQMRSADIKAAHEAKVAAQQKQMAAASHQAVMNFRYTGDLPEAIAALRQLQIHLAAVERQSATFAAQAVKGNTAAKNSMVQLERQAEKYRDKIKEIERATGRGGAGGGFGAGNMAMVMQQAAFGFDDAIQQFANTGKASSAMQAVGNNLTMIASAFGPIPVVATAAASAVATFWMKSAERNDRAAEGVERYKKALEDLKGADARARGVDEKQARLASAQAAVWTAEQKEARALKVLNTEKNLPIPEFIKQFGVGKATEKYNVARDAARAARVNWEQLRKEDAEEKAAAKFAPMRDEAAGVYRKYLAETKDPAKAQAMTFDHAKHLASGDAEAGGLRSFIGKLAREAEADRAGKVMMDAFASPRKKEIQERRDRIGEAQEELNARERDIRAGMAANNQRRMPREAEAELKRREAEIQMMRDQTAAIERVEAAINRQTERRLMQVPIPKGISTPGVGE